MRRFFRSTRRGTSLLYLTGASAVMMLLTYGLADSTVRAYVRTERAKDRVAAEWIARAGAEYARAHAQELTTSGTLERPCGAGAFRCAVQAKDGGQMLIVSARVPAERARATYELVTSLPLR